MAVPAINYFSELNQRLTFPTYLKTIGTELHQLENQYAQLTERLLLMSNFGYYLFNILMIAIIPAVGEELIFRGVFQNLFAEICKNTHASILITAILFSAVHGQIFGFLPRFVLGIFLGYLMVWSKSVWLPVLAHFVNNGLAVTAYYLANIGILKISPDSIGIENGIPIILPVSIGLTGILIFFLRKTLKMNYEIANS
jgi:membrane protease YdiL (CAAX protease family)